MVDVAHAGGMIRTDQGGDDPSPFNLFLASIASCAGFYVMSFLKRRDIPTEDVSLSMRAHRVEHGKLDRVEIEISLPEGFPQKYVEAVIKAAGSCLVKKTLEFPPEFEIKVSR